MIACMSCLVSVIVLLTTFARPARAASVPDPGPAGQLPPSKLFEVSFDGQPSFVYTTEDRGKDGYPFNGKIIKRKLPMQELSYTTVATDGPVAVVCRAPWAKKIKEAVVRPKHLGVTPEVEGDTLRFSLPENAKVSVEIDGLKHPLFILVHPPDPVVPDGPQLRRFVAGLHDLGDEILEPKSGDTLVFEPGAVVYGRIHAEPGAENISILGRGYLDGRRIVRPVFKIEDTTGIKKKLKMFSLHGPGCTVRGLSIVDPPHWTSGWGSPDPERPIVVEHVAVIGGWVANTDGFQGLENGRGRHLFACCSDDAFVVNAGVQNLDVAHAVIFNLTNTSLNLGWNGRGGCRNIRFRDIDIIHNLSRHGNSGVIRSVFGGDGHQSDIVIENLRLEGPMYRFLFLQIGDHPWAIKDAKERKISGITLRNVTAEGPFKQESLIEGASAAQTIEDIVFENLVIGGKTITALEQIPLTTNEFTRGIEVRP